MASCVPHDEPLFASHAMIFPDSLMSRYPSALLACCDAYVSRTKRRSKKTIAAIHAAHCSTFALC